RPPPGLRHARSRALPPHHPPRDEAGEPPEGDDRRAAERDPHEPFRDRLPPVGSVVGDEPAPEQVAERIACPADREKGDDGPAGVWNGHGARLVAARARARARPTRPTIAAPPRGVSTQRSASSIPASRPAASTAAP